MAREEQRQAKAYRYQSNGEVKQFLTYGEPIVKEPQFRPIALLPDSEPGILPDRIWTRIKE